MLELYRKLANLEGRAEEWRKLRRVYLAQCAKVDAMFEAVCNALKEQGMYDDAAIFFLSDHGDFAGDYHMAEKSQNTFEDVLTRVPLLIKPRKGKMRTGKNCTPATRVSPGAWWNWWISLPPPWSTRVWSRRKIISAEACSRLSPTEACGSVRTPTVKADAAPGGTVRRVALEPPVPWKDAYWAKKTAQLDDEAHVKGTMVTDGHFKFVQRLNGNHELYCLDQDPYERRRISMRQRRKTRRECSQIPHCGRSWNGCGAELLRWYQETCDVVPRAYDSRFSEEWMWRFLETLCRGEMEQTVREYIRKEHPDIRTAMQYVVGVLMRQK